MSNHELAAQYGVDPAAVRLLQLWADRVRQYGTKGAEPLAYWTRVLGFNERHARVGMALVDATTT